MKAVLAFLVLLLAAAPHALAQVPGVDPCADITMTAPATPATLRVGESADVTVEVTNPGQLAVTAVVSATTPSQGWTIQTEDQTLSIPSGGSETATFTIVATSPTGDGDIRFAATGTCDSALGTSCPGGACSAGTANANVALALQAPEGFRIPGLDNLRPEILIAAAILVLLASLIPLALRRKKGGLVADCPEPLKMVKPGRGTSFPIELRNGAKDPITAHLEVGPVPEGWSAFMPLPEVQLASRESRSLWLMVRSPATAANGEAVDVELRFREAKGKDARTVRVRAEVQGAGEA